MKCPECSFDSPDGMAFCGRCGIRLQAVADTISGDVCCPECEATMPASAAFCGRCGYHLQSRACPPEQPSQAAAVVETPRDAPLATTGPAPSAAPDATAEPAVTTDSVGSAATVGPAATLESADPEGVNATSEPALTDSAPRVLVKDPNQKVTAELESPQGAIREMVLLPASWFPMGSVGQTGNGDERPRHQVELSAFYIDRWAVTNADYEQFDASHRRLRPEVSEGDEDPVVFVTYEQCLEYCRWRSQREGVSSGTYQLPTEAQWEYAARGGFEDRLYPWGDEVTSDDCNTNDAGRGRTVPADDGKPNGFGLYHMGSNVREWCRDWYSDNYYATREATGPDPAGPGKTKIWNFRVVRGASFRDEAEDFSRCAARHSAHPPSSSDDIGFRCVTCFKDR